MMTRKEDGSSNSWAGGGSSENFSSSPAGSQKETVAKRFGNNDQPDITQEQKKLKQAEYDKFQAAKQGIARQKKKDPSPEALKGWNNSHGDIDHFFTDNKKELTPKMRKNIQSALDQLRGLYGVQQILKYDQERHSNSDTDSVIKASAVVKNFSSNRSQDAQNDTVVYQHVDSQNPIKTDADRARLVILHPTTDIIGDGVKNKEEDKKILTGKVDEIIAARNKVRKESGLSPSYPVKEIHIIPEVTSGRLRNLGVGPEAMQKASRHIRLRIVEKEAGAERSTTKVFDPRDFGLGAQGTLDDTNCGRYVAAMAIQAAGLAKDGIEITKENLKASPAIQRALHFNSKEDAQKGLENAYVKPLSKHPTPEEIIEHNVARIKYLESEYAARSGNVNREFHGHAVGGGYKTASLLTSKVAAFFKQAFSASDKLAAVGEIKKSGLLDSKKLNESAASGRGAIDPSKLPAAARQGELGKCLSAIADAQKQIIARESKLSAKK